MTKVAIAMSGGVDSSVAAAIAVEKYGSENVFGITMKLFCYGENKTTDKSCCSTDTINDAAAVCKQLGIPHYVVNLEKEFEKEIIDNFVSEYEQGRTPNPCVRCNSFVKFGHLLTKAREFGADLLVTGHYARIAFTPLSSLVANLGISSVPSEGDPRFRKDDNLVYRLLKGTDTAKDQSYFLYNLDQEQMKHIWFPLGELTKAETRKLADKYNLKTAKKTESQDICFVTTTTQEFLANKIKAKQGNIVDKHGKILGKHEGLPFYTIGQRKGLGGGFAEPMYVTRTDLVRNELVVGKEIDLYGDEMTAGEVTWTDEMPCFPAKLDVKIRYNSEPSKAILTENKKGSIVIKFQIPMKAITPGQTAVFYHNDVVVGGGTIVV